MEFKNNGDPRLSLLLKQNSPNSAIQLLGFPYDLEQLPIPRGQEYGPDCLRRFLPKIGPLLNPEFEISIENLDISDSGNIPENLEKT